MLRELKEQAPPPARPKADVSPVEAVATELQDAEQRWVIGLPGYRTFGELIEVQLGTWKRSTADQDVLRSETSLFWQRLARAVLSGRFDADGDRIVVFRVGREEIVSSVWMKQFAPQHMSDAREAAIGELLVDARIHPDLMRNWCQDFGYLVPDNWTVPVETRQMAFAKILIEQNPRQRGEQKGLWVQRMIKKAETQGKTISKRTLEEADPTRKRRG